MSHASYRDRLGILRRDDIWTAGQGVGSTVAELIARVEREYGEARC
ncbi:MAG: hypothetical protein ACT4O5_01135 [Gammaproteobacteria bacterium]